jgi:hypothetical protein
MRGGRESSVGESTTKNQKSFLLKKEDMRCREKLYKNTIVK